MEQPYSNSALRIRDLLRDMAQAKGTYVWERWDVVFGLTGTREARMGEVLRLMDLAGDEIERMRTALLAMGYEHEDLASPLEEAAAAFRANYVLGSYQGRVDMLDRMLGVFRTALPREDAVGEEELESLLMAVRELRVEVSNLHLPPVVASYLDGYLLRADSVMRDYRVIGIRAFRQAGGDFVGAVVAPPPDEVVEAMRELPAQTQREVARVGRGIGDVVVKLATWGERIEHIVNLLKRLKGIGAVVGASLLTPALQRALPPGPSSATSAPAPTAPSSPDPAPDAPRPVPAAADSAGAEEAAGRRGARRGTAPSGGARDTSQTPETGSQSKARPSRSKEG